MPDWHCHRDKVKMEETSLVMVFKYAQLAQRVPGLRCPVCGVKYLTEEVATTTVRRYESMVEDK